MTIGEKLVQLRQEAKKTRAVVAEGIGVSYTAMAMYELDLRRPSDEVKVKLAKYFGKTVGEIFFDEDYHKGGKE